MRPSFRAVFLFLFLAVVIAGGFSVRYALERIHEHETQASLRKRSEISVTIVEGKRREEIAAELQKAGVTSAADFLQASTNEEGYLFPDTYRFFPDTSATEVVTTMHDNFLRRLAGETITPQVLILASIVEREARTDDERPIIAGVYANRIAQNMKLEADPTVQYARDTAAYEATNRSLTFTFWTPITRADYQTAPGPYNTYQVDGLPPTPIANPGKKSILAALHPATHDYLYFFHRNGTIYLSHTLQEQEAKLNQQ